MSEKKKKPPALHLNPAAPPPPSTDSPDGGAPGAGIIAVDTTSKEIQAMRHSITNYYDTDHPLTEEQKVNMFQVLEEKEKIVEQGEMKEQQFVRIAELGFGNGGVVLKVEHKPTGIIMARKMIMLDIKPLVRNQIMRELKVLHECNSPYIVGFYGNFCLNNEISICMQHMDGGSLDLIMKAGRIPVKMIAKITQSVLLGLRFLKKVQNIIHRDVKPSNILVNTRGEIKLCDFGVSGQLINSMANSFVGTRSYMAPERLEGSQYSVLSDLWSLGVSLIEMALGRYPIPQPPLEEIIPELQEPVAGDFPPRQGGNPYASHANAIRMPVFELLQIITTCAPPTLPEDYFDEDIRTFVDSCLQKDVKRRQDLASLLNHPFLHEESLLSSAEFSEWVKHCVQSSSILEKQEVK